MLFTLGSMRRDTSSQLSSVKYTISYPSASLAHVPVSLKLVCERLVIMGRSAMPRDKLSKSVAVMGLGIGYDYSL